MKTIGTSRSSGFTLIEMLIVVAIVALLAAIAIPNYSQYVLRGYRTEARNLMLEIAAQQERFQYANPGYAATLPLLGKLDVQPTTNGKYNVTMIATALTYTLRATPTLSQASDRCGWLQINHLGVQTQQSINPADRCWRK